MQGRYELSVSNEILMEYNEQIVKRYDLSFADAKLDFMLLLPNVHLIHPFYNWNLIQADEDDNKFVDCAIAANADYLVTHDKHFQVLKQVDFPKVSTVNLNEFQKVLSPENS